MPPLLNSSPTDAVGLWTAPALSRLLLEAAPPVPGREKTYKSSVLLAQVFRDLSRGLTPFSGLLRR